MRRHRLTSVVQCLSGLALLAFPPAAFSADDATSQAAHAILKKHCLSCHGAAQMSGLDLSTSFHK